MGGDVLVVNPIDYLVEKLGGWPDHFEDPAIAHGRSLLAVLFRDRSIDEVVFGLVCRYAMHRATFEKLSAQIAEEALDPGSAEKNSHYLSGKEQSRAFHENKLLTLERELLATPYARSRNGQSTQTSFMEQLVMPSSASAEVVELADVFKPRNRRGNG